MSAKDTLRRVDLLRYAVPALPLAFAGIPLYVHAPDIYATEFGLSLSTIGVMLLLLRLVDALQDPLIGRLSDHFSHRRALVIILAAMLLVVGFAALFHPLQGLAAIWFALSMLLATTAYSVLSINLNSIGGLWSRECHEKTRITSMREAVGLVGLLVAVILPTALREHMDAQSAFDLVSLILLILMLIALAIWLPWYRRTSMPHVTREKAQGFWQALKQLSPASRRFMSVFGISMLASSMPAALMLFYVRDRLDAEAYTGLFLACYFVAGAASMPLWQRISRHCGKARAWLYSMILAVLCFSGSFFLGAGDVVAFTIVCIATGMAFGADLSLPPSMLADYVQDSGQEASISTHFSLLTFLLKFSLAIASASVFLLLDFAGLKPGESNSQSALMWLSITYALIPCCIKMLAIMRLWRALPLLTQGDDNAQNPHPDRSHAHAH